LGARSSGLVPRGLLDEAIRSQVYFLTFDHQPPQEGFMRKLYKMTGVSQDAATVFICTEHDKQVVGKVSTEIVRDPETGDERVEITVSREDEAWFGRVNIQVA
jgi:hypothetical protein